jgi:hypothetical protein
MRWAERGRCNQEILNAGFSRPARANPTAGTSIDGSPVCQNRIALRAECQLKPERRIVNCAA